MSVRIGVHPQTHTLTVLSRTDVLQRHLESTGEVVEFVHFGDGTETPERLVADEFDVVGTGSTPPITAQAAGAPVVYVATSAPRPDAASIVVPVDSPIRETRDLVGKRVGIAVGSWQTSLIALALANAGLGYNDVSVVDTGADGSRRDRNQLDAWAANAEELGSDEVRVVVATGDVLSNRSVFFARREFATERLDVLKRVVAAIDEAERWSGEHPADAAALVTAGTSRDAAREEVRVRSRPWGLLEISPEFAAEQQRAADVLAAAGLIAGPVTIADAVLDSVIAATTEALAVGAPSAQEV